MGKILEFKSIYDNNDSELIITKTDIYNYFILEPPNLLMEIGNN